MSYVLSGLITESVVVVLGENQSIIALTDIQMTLFMHSSQTLELCAVYVQSVICSQVKATWILHQASCPRILRENIWSGWYIIFGPSGLTGGLTLDSYGIGWTNIWPKKMADFKPVLPQKKRPMLARWLKVYWPSWPNIGKWTQQNVCHWAKVELMLARWI